MLSSTLQGADKIHSLGCAVAPHPAMLGTSSANSITIQSRQDKREKGEKKCPEESKKAVTSLPSLSVCQPCQAIVVYKTGMSKIALLETSL